jgi:hypothetical protein
MNSYALIPLVAAIAFLGPLTVVLLHRPRPRRNVLFLLFAISAVLWSLSDFLLRSGFLPTHELVLVKVVICLGVLVVVQGHYFVRSHTGKQSGTLLFAYLPLAATIGLAISGYIPRSIQMSHDVAVIKYGVWIVPVALLLLALIGHDVFLLLRKYRASEQLVERNQIAYLLASIFISGAAILAAFTPLGTEYAVPHIGNLASALILAYAIVIGHLADIGVALRRALTGFWIVGSAAAFAVLLLWLASLVVGFELTPSAAIAGIVGVLLCMLFVQYISRFSRHAIERILMGKRYDYR